MKPIFQRVHENPIITPRNVPFPAAAVLNPGAVEHNGEVVLLLRVEDHSGRSSIHVAHSANGVHGWRIAPEPIMRYGDPEYPYEQWGVEDPRVTYLEEDRHYYITYTAYSPAGAAVGIARTDDLLNAERIGLIFSPNNKDTVLFPRRFAGKWMVLHRPDAGVTQHIWSAVSPDLVHWGSPHCVLPEGTGPAWDAVKVGAGPPPLLTKLGWLLIYHGVKMYGGNLVYRVGIALLDTENPNLLIARAPGWVFQAEAPYERAGFIPSVVFPTGLLVRGDEVWIYYGAADSVICLAIARLDDLLAILEPLIDPNPKMSCV